MLKRFFAWAQDAFANLRGDPRTLEERRFKPTPPEPPEMEPAPAPIKAAPVAPPRPSNVNVLVDPADLDHDLGEDFVFDDGQGQSLGRAPLIERWRYAIADETRCWALFSFGTVVMFETTPPDPRKLAEDLLIRHRPEPKAELGATPLPDGIGWIVFGARGDVLVYVAPEEVGADAPDSRVIDVARAKLGEDAETRVVIHVQIPRAGANARWRVSEG